MPNIGFVILTHNNPEQLLRLTSTLSRAYGEQPIVCHHDFSQCPGLDVSRFPANVSFVENFVHTRWGKISVVEAGLLGMRTMCERRDVPDWIVLFSGADYPVRPPRLVLNELYSQPYDAYLSHQSLEYHPHLFDKEEIDCSPHDTRWVRKAYDRYVAVRLFYPAIRNARPAVGRLFVRNPRLLRWFHSVGASVQCYGGDTWFTVNHKAACYLASETPAHRALLRYFAKRPIPEEAVFQTILCNNPDLRLSPHNKHYADWSNDDAHPRALSLGHIHQIVASGAHFARKFLQDDPVLDYFDSILAS